ncbi:hypothetical protein SAMN02799642_00568 [Methylobacterium brachiatum]|nr:hypothetical protein SAMN02799642_00568 [Methylobacterium brachiatum]
MQLDITTLIAIGSFIVAIGTLIWRGGGEVAARKAFEIEQAKSDAERQKWREEFERSVDQRFAAVTSASTLVREQLGEVRENIAKNYVTKSEIKDVELRVTNSQDRIADHLDRIDARLNEMQARVLEAINKATSRG